MKEKDLKSESQEFIEKLYKFKREKCDGLSLMETIIEFSFKYDISLQEVGNIISEHKEFVLMFEKQLEQDGYIRREKTELDEMELDEGEW